MSSDAIEIDVEALTDDVEVDVSSVYGQEGITPTGSTEITANGTYDVTNYASAVVDVPSSGIIPTGTKSISANGTYDVTNFASAIVSVPNSYSQSDEGKVVSSGALVSQSSQTVTENGTYDTTLKNSVTVNVPSGGGLTTVASGSFVGAADYAKYLTVGTRMPKTNFWLRVKPRANSEFAYNGTYKYAVIFAIVFSDMGHYDISSNVTKKAITSDMSFNVNNDGTLTSVAVGNYLNHFRHIRNTAVGNGTLNAFSVTRTNTEFQLFFQLSNASYAYDTGVTYDWELIYFGSNPSSEIEVIS